MKAKAVVLALAMGGVMVTGGMATAADIDNCGSIRTCIYNDNNYQSKLASREHGQSEIRYVGDTATNRTSSWANNSGTYQSCGYDGANGTGDQQDWEENQHDDNLAPWNNDEVSSWRTKYGC